jgi:hypothetical protein
VYRRPYGLIAVMAAALLGAVIILIDSPTGVLKASGSLLLVLVLPGYSLSMLLTPTLQSGRQERAILTLGLSMAIAALGGLVLNLTPWGIGTQGWIALLSGVTLVSGGIALARTRPTPSAEVVGPRTAPRDAALLAMAIAVAAVAMFVARSGAAQWSETNTTQIWLLPGKQANPNEIQLGIRNLEATAKSYKLQLLSGGQVCSEWNAITLVPDEQWEIRIRLSPAIWDPGTVEALLYEAGSDTVYRRATLQQAARSSAPVP